MARSNIATTAQTLAVDQVAGITVTPPVLDTETGDYVREIRVSGQPATLSGAPVVFVLRLAGDSRDALNIVAPEQPF